MSAYVVDPGTIDLLLTAAGDRLVADTLRRAYPHWDSTPEDGAEARSMLGRYLLCMNVRSVMYRYPSDTRETVPGYAPDEWVGGAAYHPMPAYTYRRTRIARAAHGALSGFSLSEARRVLGAAGCYRSQTCELPEWDSTPAAWFVSRLVETVASGIAEGWQYTREEDATAPVSIIDLASA